MADAFVLRARLSRLRNIHDDNFISICLHKFKRFFFIIQHIILKFNLYNVYWIVDEILVVKKTNYDLDSPV